MKKLKKYIVYSTSTCPYCDLLKEWLNKNKVNYESINLSKDLAKGQEMIQKTGQMSVPVSILTFDDNKEEIVLGFNQEKLAHLLGL